MTNTIQFPTGYSTSIQQNETVIKKSIENSDSGFSGLFSTLITDMNSISASNDLNSDPADAMTALMMMMITKLFGEEAATTSIKGSIPKGTPVNGVLTQTSHEGHVALDFGVPVGTAVKTTMEGKVTFAGWNSEGYGNLVVVDNGEYKTYYAHLSKIPVKVGQTLKEGDLLGLSGNTGNSTGPHLHYEIRKDGFAINPLSTLNE